MRKKELEGDPGKIQAEDKNRCWKALKYTKPRANCTTPALQGPDKEIVVTMQAKEALVRAHAFPKAPGSQGSECQPGQGSAHLSVSQEIVDRALLCQSIKTVPGSNMHNFQALHLVWAWDQLGLLSLCNKLSVFNITPSYGDMQKEFFWRSLTKEIARW